MNARNEAPKHIDAALFSAEAEQSVLGALLLDNGSWDRVANSVRGEHFYRVDHKVIFQHIARLITARQAADVITVFEALGTSGKADEVGGLAYLNTLAQNTPGAANIDRYAQIVVERAKLRDVLNAADEIRAAAVNRNGAIAAEIVERARAKLERIVGGADCPSSVDRKRSSTSVVLTRASDITPKAIYWLWQRFLAAGMYAALAGPPGCGKTSIAVAVGAVVSRGGEWPDGTKCPEPGNVIMWTGEDGLAETLVPRFIAAGADLSRVFFVESVMDGDGNLMPFDPSRDVAILSEKLSEIGGARLLIVDPIISAVRGDSHKAADVRISLQPLLELAAAHNCALLGITHFAKGSKGATPNDRLIGSQAFGAAARVILIAGKDETSGRRVFIKSKANITDDAGGFEYSVDVIESGNLTSSRIVWGEPISASARDILREIEADEEEQADTAAAESQFERARCLIYELLRPFCSTPEIKRAAAAEGVSWRTMERAKEAEIKSGARIRAVKQGKDWGWIWDNFAANHPEEAQASTVRYVDFCNIRIGEAPDTPIDTSDSTPPDSSPPKNNSANGDGGVETQAQHGLEAKSANSAIDTGSPRARARARAGSSKTLAELADLAAIPRPVRDSTPPRSLAELSDGGLESPVWRPDDDGAVDIL